MQISSNYSMNGVPYENRRRQKDIPQFSTERAKQENKSINPYMEDTDFNEETFDMIGPNAPQEVKDAWIEAAKEEGDVDNIDILGNTTESAIQATKQALYEEYRLAGYVEELDRFLNKVSNGNVTVDDL